MRRKLTIRICKICGIQKPFEDFSPRSSTDQRRRNICKPCNVADLKRRASSLEGCARVRWRSMRLRVKAANAKYSKYYRGKGITVCKEWTESFEKFLEDMGLPPTTKHQLDRLDNSLGYCKANCRWATSLEQVRNRSNTIKVEFNGRVMPLTELSAELGIKYVTIKDRIFRGLPKDRWFEKPKPRRKQQPPSEGRGG